MNPKLKDMWSPADFTDLKGHYHSQIEEVFSKQLRSLNTKDFEKRTFNTLKEVD